MKQRYDRWIPPEDPFIEYEPLDALWARPLGFGRVEVTEKEIPEFIQYGYFRFERFRLLNLSRGLT